MPIDQGELIKPEIKQTYNPATADLEIKQAGFIKKIGYGISENVVEPVKEAKQNVSNEVTKFAISRRAFLQWLKVAVISGGMVAVATLAYIERKGIIEAIESFGDKFTVVEEKTIDPRIEKFGEDYPEWASGQARGQYNLYLMGNSDNGFNITNIPKLGEKDNTVWLLSYQYQKGICWPFVTQERDGNGKVLDQNLYPLASEESFVNRIGNDLDLSYEQRADLLLRWRFLSEDPNAVINWLEDLKSQGVKSVTDEMIKFYKDPTTYITGISQ